MGTRGFLLLYKVLPLIFLISFGIKRFLLYLRHYSTRLIIFIRLCVTATVLKKVLVKTLYEIHYYYSIIELIKQLFRIEIHNSVKFKIKMYMLKATLFELPYLYQYNIIYLINNL